VARMCTMIATGLYFTARELVRLPSLEITLRTKNCAPPLAPLLVAKGVLLARLIILFFPICRGVAGCKGGGVGYVYCLSRR
jgi:hypothetical protein